MKIKDLIEEKFSGDVTDDLTGECECGLEPIEVTEEGKKEFADVLELDVAEKSEFAEFAYIAIVHVETLKQVNRLKTFLHSVAGYCSSKKFDMWFKIIED